MKMKNALVSMIGLVTFSLSLPALAKEELCPLQFKKAKVCGVVSWTVPPKAVEMPTEKDKAEFVISFYEMKNPELRKPVQVDSLGVKLFMPSMGHGTLPTQVSQVEDSGKPVIGKFKVSDVYFSMPGAWEIRFELKKAKGVTDRVKMPYQL